MDDRFKWRPNSFVTKEEWEEADRVREEWLAKNVDPKWSFMEKCAKVDERTIPPKGVYLYWACIKAFVDARDQKALSEMDPETRAYFEENR